MLDAAGENRPQTSLTLNQALEKATRHFRHGCLTQAQEICRQILSISPDQPSVLNLLGVMARNSGDERAAHDYFKQAVELAPDFAPALYNLGLTLHNSGRLEEALACYRRVLGLQPDNAEAHNNMGNLYQSQGKFSQALSCFQKAVEINPDYFEAYFNMGLCLQNEHKTNEALACYQKALEINPEFAGAYLNIGLILHQQGNSAEAIDYYEEVLRIMPGQAEVHNNLGNVLQKTNKITEAIGQYRKAIEARPDYVKAHYNLGKLLEETHRLEEAHAVSIEGLGYSPYDSGLGLIVARCERRQGQQQRARIRLIGLLNSKTKYCLKAKADIYYELGLLSEQIKDSDKAFEHFIEANNCMAQTPEAVKTDKKYFLKELHVLASHFKRETVRSRLVGSKENCKDTPYFLVGFPRSGTTLLDQILDSHPKLRTLDEKPAFEAVRDKIQAMPKGFPGALADLSGEKIQELRKIYFAKVEEFLEPRPGAILIDKLPLNIINAGPIQRLFPQTKFILAIRHPLDVCLSCFMQNFRINSAMANFLTMEDTANVYMRVMDIWKQYTQVLPLNYQVVRYEDLVSDFEGETRKLLDFLEVEWDDGVLKYNEHALNRGKIDTPGYHQVTQPIYQKAKYRWLRYQKQIEPVREKLMPYIKCFGYE